MGPLSKVWHALESGTTAPDDEVALTIEDLLNLVQQTVLLVGQTNDTISYHRRLSALAGAMKSSSQAKSMIKHKSMLFENPGKELFGKDFDDQITDTAETQKQSKELLFNVFQQQGNNKSFSKHLPQSKLHCSGKTLASSEEAMIYDFSSRRGFNSYNNAQFKNPGKQNSDLQNNSITNTTRRVVISTTVGKKIVLQFKDSNTDTVREVIALPGQPGKTDKRSDYFANSTKEIEPKKINFSMQEKKTISLEPEILLKKVAVEQVCPQKDQFLSNIFIEKEVWGQQTCDQLEGVKPIYFFPTVAENSLVKKRIHMQTRPQGRIFMCPIFSGRPKESDVSMGRNPVPVSMTVFWPCTSPIRFHKTPKDALALLKRIGIRVVIYLDMLIIGRTREETIALRDTVILLLQRLGFVINQKKSVMTPVQEIEFLGMIVNDYFPSTEKTATNKTNVSGCVSKSKDNSFRVKSVTSPDMTILAILPAKLHCRFLEQQQIQALKKNDSYKIQVILNKESQLELPWWVKNMELYNGRTLIQLPAQALLQTDASLTFWGAVWEGMKTGGTWTQQERRMHFNELELLTLKLALETFFKAQELKSLHILVDKIVALNYFLKMGAVQGEGGGGYKKFTYGLSFQTNLGTANKEKSNCDSRVSPVD